MPIECAWLFNIPIAWSCAVPGMCHQARRAARDAKRGFDAEALSTSILLFVEACQQHYGVTMASSSEDKGIEECTAQQGRAGGMPPPLEPLTVCTAGSKHAAVSWLCLLVLQASSLRWAFVSLTDRPASQITMTTGRHSAHDANCWVKGKH
jgi:hypothetical protein